MDKKVVIYSKNKKQLNVSKPNKNVDKKIRNEAKKIIQNLIDNIKV